MKTRPQDIFPQGSGSTLDADTLDGVHWAEIKARLERLEAELAKLKEEKK